MTDKGDQIVHTLTVKAKSNSKHEYPVHITQGKKLRGDYQFKGLILSIEDTPGSWYIDTLFNFSTPPAISYPEISIHGRDWLCVNWQEVMKELRTWLVANEYIYK
jgi:hypothetical protein